MYSLKDHFRRSANDSLKLMDGVALAEFAEQGFLLLRGTLC